MGTLLRVLSESYQMNTNMTGFRCFSKIFVFVLWTNVASALEGLNWNWEQFDIIPDYWVGSFFGWGDFVIWNAYPATVDKIGVIKMHTTLDLNPEIHMWSDKNMYRISKW